MSPFLCQMLLFLKVSTADMDAGADFVDFELWFLFVSDGRPSKSKQLILESRETFVPNLKTHSMVLIWGHRGLWVLSIKLNSVHPQVHANVLYLIWRISIKVLRKYHVHKNGWIFTTLQPHEAWGKPEAWHASINRTNHVHRVLKHFENHKQTKHPWFLSPRDWWHLQYCRISLSCIIYQSCNTVV